MSLSTAATREGSGRDSDEVQEGPASWFRSETFAPGVSKGAGSSESATALLGRGRLRVGEADKKGSDAVGTKYVVCKVQSQASLPPTQLDLGT
jgi:hypothetical protein